MWKFYTSHLAVGVKAGVSVVIWPISIFVYFVYFVLVAVGSRSETVIRSVKEPAEGAGEIAGDGADAKD